MELCNEKCMPYEPYVFVPDNWQNHKHGDFDALAASLESFLQEIPQQTLKKLALAQEKDKERGSFGTYKNGKKSPTWNGHRKLPLAIIEEEVDNAEDAT